MESLGLVVVPNDDDNSDGHISEPDDESDDEHLGGHDGRPEGCVEWKTNVLVAQQQFYM